MTKRFFFTMLSVMVTAATHAQQNQLTDQEKKEGWKLLFDGRTSKGWHTYNKKTFGEGWKVSEGTLFRDTTAVKKEAGDICTDEVFENFDLKLQWKISKDGNRVSCSSCMNHRNTMHPI